MNVLIISDSPELSSFEQILSLKQDMQRLDVKVNTFMLSSKGAFWNNKEIKKNTRAIEFLADLFHEKNVDLVAVSLTLSSYKQLFTERSSILDLVSPQTDVFIFGGCSVLKKMDKDRNSNIFLYQRRGVAKITKEFKMAVLDRIKKKKAGT